MSYVLLYLQLDGNVFFQQYECAHHLGMNYWHFSLLFLSS